MVATNTYQDDGNLWQKKMIKKFKHFQKGFTLVEAMVALAIMAVAILALMQTNVFQSDRIKTDRIIEQSAEICNYLFEDLTTIYEKDLHRIGPLSIEDSSTEENSFTVDNVPENPPEQGDKFLVQGIDKIWTVNEYSDKTIIVEEESIETEAQLGSQVKFISFARSAIDDYRILPNE